MKENNSKKRNPPSIKKIFIIFLFVGIVCGILLSIVSVKNAMNYYNDEYGSEHEHDKYCYKYEYRDDYYSDNYNEYGYRTYRQLEEYKFDCPQVVYDNAFLYAISNGRVWSIFSICIVASMVLAGLFILIRKFKKKQKEEEKKLNGTTNILD